MPIAAQWNSPVFSGRRLPIGAEVVPGGRGVHFRVWAPGHERVGVVLEDGEAAAEVALALEPEGYFSGLVEHARAGSRYRYRLGDDDKTYPDPASRFQPEGPHGPAQVIDPAAFNWSDQAWRGSVRHGQVLYEMHVGTFTPEGTWEAAARELLELAALGITLIEMMPVADFPGRFGWGYDGVNPYAPTRLYGAPDDLRRFIDRAHGLGIGVILDVVYNHLGPDGNYLARFSPYYFSDRHDTDWGKPLNFDGENAGPVRELFIANAGYWIDEYHFDGLRLDATQNVYDDSTDHMIAAITRRARAAAGTRPVYVIGENEPQDSRLLRAPASGGYGLDALWNDDFHHSAMVALTGRHEAYYSDYRGRPQEFIALQKWGFLYQGQRYQWQGKRRGTPTLDLPPDQFIHFLQNHDQVANSSRALRLSQLASPGAYRALTALLLLGPQTPLLFQGQEFAASSPFLYFADHAGEDLGRSLVRGRAEFLGQFRSLAQPEMQALFADPADPATFSRSKLDFMERGRHAEVYALHRDLLRLRREDPVISRPRRCGMDGAVLGAEALVMRFFGEPDEDRLLLVNLGIELHLDPAPEPLLAPPLGKGWRVIWSSENPRYGGDGTPPVEGEDNWWLPARSAILLIPGPDATQADG